MKTSEKDRQCQVIDDIRDVEGRRFGWNGDRSQIVQTMFQKSRNREMRKLRAWGSYAKSRINQEKSQQSLNESNF